MNKLFVLKPIVGLFWAAQNEWIANKESKIFDYSILV